MKNIKVLILVGILVFGAVVYFAISSGNLGSKQQEEAHFVLGYDPDKKAELFGTMTEDEIADLMAESIQKLKEADQKGHLQEAVQEVEELGFYVIAKNRKVITKPRMVEMQEDKKDTTETDSKG